MKELAIMLRVKQLFAHNAHNLVSGALFMQDHNYLGELYPTYEEAYDSVVERIIGLYGKGSVDLLKLQLDATQKLAAYNHNLPDNKTFFSVLLECEQEMCKHIEQLVEVPGVTQGTINLLADLADKSEARQYKLKARIA